MKKKVLLILFIMFTSFIGVLNVKAEVLIKSFRCYYNIKNEQNIQLGTMQVEINNYNDGNGSYTYEVIHKKENGDMGKYKGGTTTDYYNYDLNNGRYLSMFCGKTVACSKINETEIKKFVDYYKSNGTCSNLYYNLDGDSQARIETEAKDVNSNVPMVSYTTMFKGPNDSKWISQAEFEKRRDDNKQTAEGKDMICKYRMKFDLITGMFDVVFSKKVNKNTGNITYSITINGVETPINSLSETIFVPIGGFSGATVKVFPDDLKAILDRDTCIDGGLLYHYSEAVNSDVGIEVITVDPNKAVDEGIAGRVGNGNGDEPSEEIGLDAIHGTIPQDPDTGFGPALTCADLLGNNLTKVVHVAIKGIQIIGAVVAITMGMILLIPAIMAKDAEGLKKAAGKLKIMAIVLVLVFFLPYLARLIGTWFGFDLSCLV